MAVRQLSARDTRALSDNWAQVWLWIFNHAELCEEKDVLRKLDRNAGRVSDLIVKLNQKKRIIVPSASSRETKP